jgi:predicted transposase/invertase (TIGR01784 family)
LGQYDITIKHIFSNLADDIIQYFLKLKLKKIEELNLEFTIVKKRQSDMIFKCQTDTGDMPVHIEFQSGNDSKLPYRMLRYSIEIMEKYELPPYQIVIYMGKKEPRMQQKLTYEYEDTNRLDYRYKLIDLGEIKFEEIINTGYYDLYSLLPLVDRNRRQKQGEKYIKECADSILKMPMNINRKKDIAFYAGIFSGLMFNEQEVKKAFEEVVRMLNLEESSFYRLILEEGKKKGLTEGIKEGIKEGLKEGKADTAIRLLKKKFGTLSKEAEEKILKANKETLDKILDDIFTIEKLEDLNKY